jgi:hypothetical protein
LDLYWTCDAAKGWNGIIVSLIESQLLRTLFSEISPLFLHRSIYPAPLSENGEPLICPAHVLLTSLRTTLRYSESDRLGWLMPDQHAAS